MSKSIINNTLIVNEFFEDAILIGIQCPIETHRFVWMVNRVFGYRFEYQNNGEIKLREQKRNYEFPVYCCRESNLELVHYLYVNNDDGKHLLPELKHIDFLWLLKGESSIQTFSQTLMNELRKLEQVLMVVELTGEKIRHKEHLIL